jgi:ABC-type multidrug transport system fused ATPase/permease subunit
MRFFDTNPVGRIVTRFSSDYGNVFRLFGGPFAELLSIIFDLACMVILVSVASLYYLPIIALIAVFNYFVYRMNRDRLRVERRDLSASRSPSIAHFAETTQGASTIRIFGRQLTFLKRFIQLSDRFQKQRVSAAAAVLIFSMQMSLLTGVLLLITGLAGYEMAKQGMVSIGSIGVAFTFIVLSGTSIQMFFEWMAQFEEAMTGVERLNDYLVRPLEPGSKLPSWRSFPTKHPAYAVNEEEELKRQRLVSAPAAAVSVEDLWFRYAPDLPIVLKGINAQIRPGEKIGIVGRTGSGKSSFVQALFHMYPFEKGRIAIDGHAPGDVDLQLYRRAIALIAQEPTLFRGSLRENLDLAGAHSDDEINEALDRVGLGDWLNERGTVGLKFNIEEKGRNLSAGERQLLCMARCLLQDAPVVILDEATSSVDPQSEEILVDATEKFFADRTVIIIAHRLSTLEKCDRVLWLHQGEVKMFDEASRVLPVFRATQLS